MINTNNNDNGGLIFSDEIKSLLMESGKALLERQRDAARRYNRQTGTLQDALSHSPFSVTDTGDVQSLLFSYPKHIRALDRQRTIYGRKKDKYIPIYNRLLYGEIYRYTIPVIRGIIRKAFRQQRANLKQIFNKPIKL
nr:hypothetical protein [uncultured Butyricimonas sp.]